MSRFGFLYRGSRRIPMTAKRGHEYYKGDLIVFVNERLLNIKFYNNMACVITSSIGNRSGAIGSHTKKGRLH